MVVGKQVEIRRISKGRYGRTVGELFLAAPHIARRNVQREMVASGHAVVLPPRYSAMPLGWSTATSALDYRHRLTVDP